MPSVDFIVSSKLTRSMRVQQLAAMFDVPLSDYSQCSWKFDVPFDDHPWNVGLIVGPSGSGKTSVSRELFKAHFDVPLKWSKQSVIDDFSPSKSMIEIQEICRAVGFNTIPAWLRPYSVLSNGERFRVDLARRLLECKSPVVVDEFSSVVDRQVAKIGAFAVQKYARKTDMQFVASTCHYDVIDWLRPDWILEPGIGKFARRSLQPRPTLPVEICRVDYSAWKLFAPFHYLTATLHRGANCFVLFVDGRPASFCAVLHRPHPKVRDIKGVSRAVTLPDWQGLGLIFVLLEVLGAAYKALGFRLHTYPAHPSFIRSTDRTKEWLMVTRPTGVSNPGLGGIKRLHTARPCAVFRYVGKAMNRAEAKNLIEE